MSSGEQETNLVQEPWGPSQPFMEQGMGSAANLFGQGGFEKAPYAFDRVAPQSDMTQQAYSQIQGLAGQPNAGLQQAGQTLGGMMDMDQQYRNFDQVQQNVMDRVMPRINDQFSSQGMANSTLHSAAAGDAAARGMADVEYGAYNQAQNRGLTAAGMTPAINQAQYYGSGVLGGAGAGQDFHNQQIVNADQQYWDQSQQAPIDAMTQYGNLIQGYGGKGSTGQETSGYNPGFMDYLSGGLQSLSLFDW